MGGVDGSAEVSDAVGGLGAQLQWNAVDAELFQVDALNASVDVADLQRRQTLDVVDAALHGQQLPAFGQNRLALLAAQRGAFAVQNLLFFRLQFGFELVVGAHDGHQSVLVVDQVAADLIHQVVGIGRELLAELLDFGVDLQGLDGVAAVVPQRGHSHDHGETETGSLVLDAQLDAVQDGLDPLAGETLFHDLLQSRLNQAQHLVDVVVVDA